MDVIERLTDRQRQVIRLAGEGLTVDQTAARLFISRTTVRMHRRNAFVTLGVNKIAAAVRMVGQQ